MSYLAIAFLLFMSLGSSTGLAAGVLKLSRTELRFTPDEPQGELYAQNIGDSPLYLEVEQQLVLNPGQTPERLLPIHDVQRPSLLVTPGRLVLAPGQKYGLTLKALNIPTHNQVWRITFRPRERLIVEASTDAGQPAPLAVSVGYGVVIYQRAANNPLRPVME
ncbi:hypothetical protein P3C29_29615 [Pseudomonas sp. 1912-s]|uniref:hypothetical protein n=1 Tax=Pseudomonas sp. 1912-s TaxID=3033802 RepID=UPI0023DEA388|nr:hypothetical protein [Pseudomonas sp. 1912-s]MDF3202854.1 hypothetical protein [Pseudomonas sp. 1912-s]